MESYKSVHRVKVDGSGRILLPSEMRERRHIANGDTIVLVEDESGVHLKTLDRLIADVQAHFAKYVPADVLLSEEVNQDRRAEHERD